MYPYDDDRGRTHYDGCWRERGHHNCAVAEIERLRTELDAAKPAAWIPLAERKPEIGQLVALYDNAGRVRIGKRRPEEFHGYPLFAMRDNWVLEWQFSHWLPLPEPPKKDGDA